MRVNVDSQAITDPRFKRLGRALGIAWQEALGRSLVVWLTCYESRSAISTIENIDIAAERDGFGIAMLAVGLADQLPENDNAVWLHGVEERIQFLERQSHRGKLGGQASAAATAKRTLDHTVKPTVKRTVKHTVERSLDLRSSQSLDLSLSLSPDLDLKPLKPPLTSSVTVPNVATPRVARKRSNDESPGEAICIGRVLDRLAKRTGRAYGGDRTHRALVLRLLRDGYSVWDMRRVIAYCGDQLGWDTKEDMNMYMRPSTLFGPIKFSQYVGDARIAYPQPDPGDQETT